MEEANGPETRYDDRGCFGTTDCNRSNGPGADLRRLFELALQIQREQYLKASRYERTPERRGYANGYREKSIDTHVGTVTLQVPETAGHEGEPFYPRSLERGRRSSRAVMPTVAGMYIKGVSTRQAEAVMRGFGIESLSSTCSALARIIHQPNPISSGREGLAVLTGMT